MDFSKFQFKMPQLPDVSELTTPYKPPDLTELTKNMRVPPSAEQTQELISTTGLVKVGIEALAQSSNNLEALSAALIKETANVHREVAILANSSEKLEKLTLTLKNLTWALIFLTVLAVGTPIGIEVWKAFHPEAEKPVHVSPPQPNAPQMPN